MKRVAALTVVMASLLSPSPSLAGADVSDGENMAAFARCELKADRHLTIDFVLDTQPAEHSHRYDGLGHRKCVLAAGMLPIGTFRLNPFFFSASVSKLLLKGRDLSLLEGDFASTKPFVHERESTWADHPESTVSRERFEQAMSDRRVERLYNLAAECVVRRAPSISRSVFETFPATVSTVIDPLEAELSTCKDSQMTDVSPSMLQDALALAYLRLAVAVDPSLKEKLYDA